MIYLDNAASTRIHDDVLNSMLPFLKEQYGNPSSIHRQGRLTRKAVNKARKQIASIINADPAEILITDLRASKKMFLMSKLLQKKGLLRNPWNPENYLDFTKAKQD